MACVTIIATFFLFFLRSTPRRRNEDRDRVGFRRNLFAQEKLLLIELLLDGNPPSEDEELLLLDELLLIELLVLELLLEEAEQFNVSVVPKLL